MLEPNQIYLGPSELLLGELGENSIDLIVSSPPYKTEDGFHQRTFENIFSQLYRVAKPNSLFFLNFGHLSDWKFRPFEVCALAMYAGFLLNDTIVWVKNHFSPIQGKKHLNNLTEFIFVLYKGQIPDLDRLSIGIPYKDASNAARFNNGVNLRCAGNVWQIDYETIQSKEQKLHKDRFPLELPTRCIKLSGIKPGSLVLDPFSGSSTTALAAKNLGMNYLGFEKDPKNIEISKHRLL